MKTYCFASRAFLGFFGSISLFPGKKWGNTHPAPAPAPALPAFPLPPLHPPGKGLNASARGFSFLAHRAYGKRCFQGLVGHFRALRGYHLNADILAPSAHYRAIDQAFRPSMALLPAVIDQAAIDPAFQPSMAFPRYFPCTGFISPVQALFHLCGLLFIR